MDTKKLKEEIISFAAGIICCLPVICYASSEKSKTVVSIVLSIVSIGMYLVFLYFWGKLEYKKMLSKSNSLKSKLTTSYQEVKIDFKNSTRQLEELKDKKVFAKVDENGRTIIIQNFSRKFHYNTNQIIFLDVKTT